MSVAASKSVTESAIPEAKVTGIFIYPVKSCRGISLSQAPLTPSGIIFFVLMLFLFLTFVI